MSELERSRQRVLDVARGELMPLLSALSGRVPGGGATAGGRIAWLGGDWAGCEDLGNAIQFTVTGRVDLPPATGRPGGDRLLTSLTRAGWTARHDRGTDPRRRGMARDSLRLELVEYPDTDFVLVSLAGPCLSGHRATLDSLLAEPRVHLVAPA